MLAPSSIPPSEPMPTTANTSTDPAAHANNGAPACHSAQQIDQPPSSPPPLASLPGAMLGQQPPVQPPPRLVSRAAALYDEAEGLLRERLPLQLLQVPYLYDKHVGFKLSFVVTR